MKKPTSIILHHSATADGKTLSWNAIREGHLKKGWRGIGYHFGVELVGEVVEVLLGRTLLEDGAHTVGRNSDSVGVCVVGNYDVTSPSDKHISTLVQLLKWLCVEKDIPVSQIRPHRDFANTACCGKNFPVQEVRDEVARLSIKMYIDRTKNLI